MVVGLVGCGDWGVHILRDLRALGCDVPVAMRSDESRSHARVKVVPSVVVADVSTLGDVDGIVVATPTSSHAEVVRSRARARRARLRREASVRRRCAGRPPRELGAGPALRDGQVALPPRRPRIGRDRAVRGGSAACSALDDPCRLGHDARRRRQRRGCSHLTTWRSRSRSSAGVPQPVARSAGIGE